MKTCTICKEEILSDKQRYVRLTDFSGKLRMGEVFYHLECWNERFQITNSRRKKDMYSKAIKVVKDALSKGGITITQ